ncbi:MAG: hypothetical protein RR050_02390 [Bacilli bacterium]
MKKLVILIISCFSLLISYSEVKAITLEPGQAFSKQSFGYIYSDGIKYGDNTLNMINYQFSSKAFTGSVIGYCMDPNSSGTGALTVKRILGDSSQSDFIASFDYGMLEILKKGYSQYHTSFSFEVNGENITLSGNDLILATNIAVRTYTLGLFSFGKSSAIMSKNLTSAYINEGAHWAALFQNNASNIIGTCKLPEGAKYDYANAFKCFKNHADDQYGTWYNQNINFKYGDKNSKSYKVIYTAQELFRLGLEVANNYAKSDSSVASVKVSEISSTKTKGSEEKIITFNIKGLVDTGKVNQVSISCDDCASKGISLGSIEFLNGNVWQSITPDVDLSKHVDKNGNAQIKIIANKTAELECSPANYKIHYQIIDPNSEYNGAILHNKNKPNSTQRYLVLVKTWNTSDRTFSGSIACDNVACETKITTPVCSDENDGVATITAPKKITKCILGKTDDAGNTYQLSSTNGGVDNSYCEVFCKEDYSSITLNKAVFNVTCGGYFKLKANVKGSKDCYTSSNKTDFSINKEQYLEDIKNVQVNMISVFNEIKMYEAAIAKGYKPSFSSCASCNGGGGSYTNWLLSGNYTGKVITFNNEGIGYTTNQSFPYNFDAYGDSGSCSYVSCGKDGKDSCCSSCSGCKDGIQVNLSGLLSSAKQKLTEYQDKYKDIIRNYNSCTTKWTNDFNFDQTVGFEYDQESYYKLLNESDPSNRLLIKNGSESKNSSIKVCLGSINNEYDCKDGFKIIYSNDSSVDNFYYNSDYKNVFSSNNYVYCTDKSCENINVSVSNASYVKKSVEKEQNYITPTVFYQLYPSGKITTYEHADKGLQASPLFNGLPISPNTVGGGVFKLKISNLGEFYENGDNGRLIDFEGNRETDSVAYKQHENNTVIFNGEYICYYYSPCRPDDCPHCDFGCVGEKCEFELCDNCVIGCINCMFDLNELQLNFKTISTNNINSANREFGYNWNINTKLPALSLLANKATTTIEEINEKNDTIYDDKETDNDTSLAFSIKMTPNVTNYIKSQNETINKENIGGYGNNSLTCYEYNDGTKKYDNLFCYSGFIDDLIKNPGFKDLILTPRRENNINNRKSNPNNNKYWTPWNGYQYEENIIGGPAWK